MKKSLLLAINKSNPGSPRTVHSPQIESSQLREKVKKAEEQLNDDKVVAALESEVNWFKDEANRLSDQAERMNNDNNHLLHRIEALYEQRRYLSDQLKAIMKRSKVYESSTSLNGRNILPRVPTRTSTCQRPRTSSSMQKPKLKDILVKQIEVDDDDPNDLWLALDKLNETRTSCETALEESILKTLHEEIITRKFPNHLQPINSLSVKSLELENMRTISKSHIEGITEKNETDREQSLKDPKTYVGNILVSLQGILSFEAEMKASFDVYTRGEDDDDDEVESNDANEESNNESTSERVKKVEYESITEAFDPYLGPYVQLEREGLDNIMSKLSQEETASIENDSTSELGSKGPYNSSSQIVTEISLSITSNGESR
eukprot:gene18494-24210_t